MSTTQDSPDRNTHARLKRVVQRIYDIPSFPQVILRLAEVAEDPNSSSADLAAVMDKDQGLSAKVLKLVNSAFYSLPRPVSSLRHAITLVGFNSVRSLAISVSVRGAFPGDADAAAQQAFWEHSLTVACATRHLGEINRLPYKDDLFTAGLMHDIGVLVSRRYLEAEVKEADKLVTETGITSVQSERQVIGVEHTLLGAWLAEHWRLPPLLHAAIRDHHEAMDPNSPQIASLDDEMRKVVELVALGDDLANRLGACRIIGMPEPTWGTPPHLIPYLGGRSIQEIGQEILEKAESAREFVAV